MKNRCRCLPAPTFNYRYGPFGEPVRATGTIGEKCPFRFSTKFTDNETGLLYYGYRYYNPVTGRWLNRDPVGERGGINLFCFVGNDPIYSIDPFGLEREASDLAISIDVSPCKKVTTVWDGGLDAHGETFYRITSNPPEQESCPCVSKEGIKYKYEFECTIQLKFNPNRTKNPKSEKTQPRKAVTIFEHEMVHVKNAVASAKKTKAALEAIWSYCVPKDCDDARRAWATAVSELYYWERAESDYQWHKTERIVSGSGFGSEIEEWRSKAAEKKNALNECLRKWKKLEVTKP